MWDFTNLIRELNLDRMMSTYKLEFAPEKKVQYHVPQPPMFHCISFPPTYVGMMQSNASCVSWSRTPASLSTIPRVRHREYHAYSSTFNVI